MVTSYYIMKMAKNKKHMSTDEYFNNVYNEPISKEFKDNSKCRVCLKDGIVSILGDENKIDIIEALSIFGSIEISEDDMFPKYLCNICYKFINSALMFRKIARKTNDSLKQLNTRKINETTTENDWVELSNDLTAEQQSPKIEKDLDPLVKLRKEELERSNRRVQCPTCKKIVRKSYYKIHKTMHDPNHHKYICDVCGKSFRLRCAYYSHTLRHGNGNNFPYKCQFCPYRGKYADSLRAHKRIHTGDMKYMCTECPARFLYKSNLNTHVLNKHREKEHKCDTCKRAFHTKLAVQRHYEVDHLGIKTHVCNICGNAFGYRNAMMKHQRRVHKREKLPYARMPSYLQAENNNQNSNV